MCKLVLRIDHCLVRTTDNTELNFGRVIIAVSYMYKKKRIFQNTPLKRDVAGLKQGWSHRKLVPVKVATFYIHIPEEMYPAPYINNENC